MRRTNLSANQIFSVINEGVILPRRICVSELAALAEEGDPVAEVKLRFFLTSSTDVEEKRIAYQGLKKVKNPSKETRAALEEKSDMVLSQ